MGALRYDEGSGLILSSKRCGVSAVIDAHSFFQVNDLFLMGCLLLYLFLAFALLFVFVFVCRCLPPKHDPTFPNAGKLVRACGECSFKAQSFFTANSAHVCDAYTASRVLQTVNAT